MTAAAYLADGRPVAREAFYALACDPRRNVVVEACAGAGKTWMLVSRILRALLDGAEPHEILAITYTRKAAGEMRERLNAWLCAFGVPGADEASRVQALVDRGLPRAEAERSAPRLARLRERVLAAGRPVEIRTFHAWFAQVLRAAPLEALAELGIAADVELVEDPSDHRVAVFRRFHAAVLADAALHADYHALVARRGRSQVRKWLEAAWDRHVEIELADRAGVLEASVPLPPSFGLDEHPARALLEARWQNELALLIERFGPGVRARDAAADLRLGLEIADAEARFEQVWKALFTQENTPRKQLGKVAELDRIHDELERLGRQVRQFDGHVEHGRMVRLSRALLAEYAAYKRSRGLADMGDLERAGLALLGEATLAGWLQERLDARVRHVLIDEFQDTSPLQWHALQAWLGGYAGAGGGASGLRPPGVFIVGDPKQSIYRFRRAEPRVFAAAREFVVDGLDGVALACDHTRRNAPAVLAALNAVFREAQDEGEFEGFRTHTTEQATGAATERAAGHTAGHTAERATEDTARRTVGHTSDHTADASPTPTTGVERFPIVPRPERRPRRGADDAEPPVWRDTLTVPRREPERVLREQEAAQVAASVATRLAAGEARAGEVFVLCRKRESLRLVADALHALGIASSAIEETALMDLPEARDLVAVVDALVSPRHRLSLAQALRSPLFGASDDDLLALAAAAVHGDWWDALLRGRWDAGPTASPALLRARTLLPAWRQAGGALPPHDLLDRIVAEGELRERVAAAVPPLRRAAALAAIDAVVGEALTRNGARYATPYNFVRSMKRDAIRARLPADLEAVQLLTVHGAKGLEAEVVYVVDADPEPRNAETATVLVDWPVASPTPRRCAFVYSESKCPPSLDAPMALELDARRREELNGLYVAMSRAKRRLVFSATAPSKRATDRRRSWWQRIEAVAAPVEPPAAQAIGTAAAESTTVSVRALVSAAPRAARPADGTSAASGRLAVAEGAVGSADHRRLGEAVHRVLEWATRPGVPPERRDVGLDALADAAAIAFDVPAAAVRHLAATILTSPACARFYAADVAWAGNEVGISEGGELLRIDRLVRLDTARGAEWWVLDYKLHHAPEALDVHREQLRRYRRAVEQAEPGAVVRCAFVTSAGKVVEAGD